ncbi:MAG TPA: single-stranded-DNA-specific exonuclease RecJ [Vicinamibacterales bacterium]|nr:single-stranded-DNA-specific exonuclease RecJ [Vicinamibacterales bacterium]
MAIPYLWERMDCNDRTADVLAHELRVSPAIARLLTIRGVDTPELAQRFLHPSLDHLHDPFRLADMPAAVERILGAIERKERIAVHGDYDCDGITSTVILRRALELFGATVVHFIPDRIKDGYGLQPETFDRLLADGVQLVISVDCGIRGNEAARRARELKIDLVITDHHEPGGELPDAIAVINPKRHDCGYPDKHLAGVGVALKLVQALCRRRDRERMLPAFIKVAAIGTLADVVPLVGENRVIAKLGLEMLSKGPHKVGLRALLDVAGLTGKPIDGGHVAFQIAPRMNAAGRMATPEIAARLLLAADDAMAGEAQELARQLDGENTKRQVEEASILSAARKIVETDPAVGARSILVVAGEGWHRGVIGIVASKLVDAFHRPAIVISMEGDVAHGSCRSIRGFDVLAALEQSASHLIRFGGHKQAAGLTMASAGVPAFRESIADHADNLLGPDELRPRLRIDGCLGFRDINGDFAGEMALLAPFGMGNPRPLFEARGVEVVDGPRRLKDKHLKMALKQNGRIFRAIAWRAVEREEFITANRASLDLAFSLEHNRYQGNEYLELSVSDLRTTRGVER